MPGPERQVPEIDVLEALALSRAPVAGTSEVADEIEVERQTAEKYLWDLNASGMVATRKIGQARIWWLTDEGREKLSERD